MNTIDMNVWRASLFLALALPAAALAQTYDYDAMADMDPQPADRTDWFTSQNWGEQFGEMFFDPLSPSIPDTDVRVEIWKSMAGVDAPEIRMGAAQAHQVRIGREDGPGLLTLAGGSLSLNLSTPMNRFRVGNHDPEDVGLPLEQRNPGKFNMTGGTLSVASLWVGSGSHGEMNLSAGSITTTENLYMDWPFDADSVLNITGGAINVGGVMRMYRNATFNLDGGQLNITGSLELGAATEPTQPFPQTPNVNVTINDGIIVAGSSMRTNGSVKLNGGIVRAASFTEFFSTPGSLKINDGGTLQLRTSNESVAAVNTLIAGGYIGTDSPQGTGAFQIGVVNIGGTDFTQITLPESGSDGDFDEDQDVDGADFLVWQQQLGVALDADDLTVWKQNFGAIMTVASAASVPEPSALVMGLVACLSAGLFRYDFRRIND
jgi:hypothetical protein